MQLVVLTRPVTPSSFELCQAIGKRDGRIQQRVEVVGVVRVLPEVVGVDQQKPADRLLQAGIELIPVARAACGTPTEPNTF